MQNKFLRWYSYGILILVLLAPISFSSSTITIPIYTNYKESSLCIDSNYESGKLADVNQLNCLDNGNSYNAKYGVGKVYVKQLSNDTGLILHLTFDNCNLEDVSGIKNSVTYDNLECENSVFGKSMGFNGVNSSIVIPHRNLFDSSRITISVWMKIDAIRSTQTIVAKSDYPLSGYFLRLYPGTTSGVKITFFIGDSNGVSHVAVADDQEILNKWVHIVARYDGSEQSIWIDGKKVSYITWNGDIGINTKNLEIGNEYGSNYFSGLIDEVSIYDRALNDKEIKNLFHEKLVLHDSEYNPRLIIDKSSKFSGNRSEIEIFLNNQYYLNKTYTIELPLPDGSNASVFYAYPSGYMDVRNLSAVGHGIWNYSIEKSEYGIEKRLVINATLAGADGFDYGIRDYNPDSFFYKREITINNSQNNQNLTDYQVKLTLDTQSLISQGKMNSDCSDIRFYYYNYSTDTYQKIPYWIESGCNSTNTVIWIKVPFIPDNQTDIGFGNGIAKVYMYYGNPYATSESNGDAVFLFFDDFNGDSLDTSKWKIVDGSPEVKNSTLILENCTAYMSKESVETIQKFQRNISMIVRLKSENILDDLTSDKTYQKFGFNSLGNYNYTYLDPYVDSFIRYYRWYYANSTNTGETSSFISWSGEVYRVFRFVWLYNKIGVYDEESSSGNTINGYTPEGELPVAFDTKCYNDVGRNTLVVDWVLIKNQAENELSASIGNEQINKISEIQLSTDFLKVLINKNFYEDKSHPVSLIINDYENNFLYEINLSDISIDNSKVYQLYPNYTVYFYDWLSHVWKIWQKGANNSTHGMPNWLSPAFKQAFKWRFSFSNSQNTSVNLNITFLLTAHDPFIRIFVDGNDEANPSYTHTINIPIKTKEKKYFATIINNTFSVFDSSNISSFNNVFQLEYRKPIIINNSQNNQNLTDYQIAINISYSSHMQPNFDDIRFYYVNSSGEYKIPYWIQEKVNSSWAYVWIKVPFIPDNQTDIGFGNGIAKVYMYYGNPSATSESNGDAVFLFFDDFNGDSLDTSKWNVYTYGSGYSYSVSNGMLYLYTSGTGAQIGINSTQPYDFTDDVSIGFRVNFTSLGPTDFASLLVHLVNRTTGSAKGVQWYAEGSWDRYVVGQNGSYWWSGTNKGAATGVSTHLISINTYSDTLYWKAYGSRNFDDSTSKIDHFPVYPNEYLKFVCANGGALYLDWIFVKKFSDPEPIYSIGEEETTETNAIHSTNVMYENLPSDIALFFTQNTKSIYLKLSNTSSDRLDLINYTFKFSGNGNILLSFGYTLPIDTTEGNLTTWSIGFSNESIDSVANSTMTYYDIISWDKEGDYNYTQHNVSLVFHYNETYKDDFGVGWYNYTSIEDSLSFTGSLVSDRSVSGNTHKIVNLGTSTYLSFNLTDHDSIRQNDYDQRRIKIVIDHTSLDTTYKFLDSLDERYGIRNQNEAYILLADKNQQKQLFISSTERSLSSFKSDYNRIKTVNLNLSAYHSGLTLGYISSDITEDSDLNSIPDLLENKYSIGFSSSEKLADFTRSSLGYYLLGYDGYKFIATFAYLDNQFSYAPFYLIGLKQPVGVENAYEIGYRTSNGTTWYMYKSQPISKFHLNSTSVAQTSNMIKYITFKKKNITIYPEDELYIEGLPTTLSGEGEINYVVSNFLPKAELKLYVKYNQTMSYWVNYILPASADYLIIEISNPEKTHFSMQYNLTDHDKITIPTNDWVNDYWYNINSTCYSKDNLKYGMICSDASPEEVAIALVAGYGIVDSVCYGNNSKYSLSLNTTSNKIIIPLTDNCRLVVNKMRSIQTYGIPTTSFNEKTAKSNYVTMTLSYDRIKIAGSLSFSNGYYRLCVRNVGREYGTTLVEIVRC